MLRCRREKPKFITIRGDGAGTDFSGWIAGGTLSAIRVETGGAGRAVDPRQRFSGKTSVVGQLGLDLAIYNRALDAAESPAITISGHKAVPGK